MVSGLSHILLNLNSNIPTIGASGAIAGVMGVYFILHPRARILTLIPIFFIPYFLEIPAYIFLGIWFVLQLTARGCSLPVFTLVRYSSWVSNQRPPAELGV